MSEVLFNGKKVSYTTKGEGPALVLLHGYLETKEVWDAFSSRFGSYKLIMPDLPGHGHSAVYKDAHTMEFMAEAVSAILEKENIKKCIIYGHSMGGYVAEAFARKYPEKVKALGLIHSTIYPDNEDKKTNRKREIALLRKGKQKQVVSGMLPNIVAKSNLEKFRPELQKIVDRANKFPVNGIIAILNGMMERPEHKINTNIPFHLIGGDEDNFIPISVYEKMAADNPSIKFDMIKGAGHASFIEKPEELLQKMQSFISKRVR